MRQRRRALARKRNRTRARGKAQGNQAIALNAQAYAKNMQTLVSIALSRFKIEGLPDTCNERFLLWALLRYGYATICRAEGMPDVWQTLQAVPQAEYNAYGYPVRWRALGVDGRTQYDVTEDNGALIYYSRSSAAPFKFGDVLQNPWSALDNFAQRLTRFEMAERVNLTHQQTPWVLIVPPEKELEAANLFSNIMSGQPAVFGNDTFGTITDDIRTIDTHTPFIAEELARARMNCFHEAMLFLGVPHLAFEKGERMIEDEARANTAPTNLMLLDCLQGMRDGFDELNRRFGLDIHVYYNQDNASLNYNYLSNIEAQAQDGILNG